MSPPRKSSRWPPPDSSTRRSKIAIRTAMSRHVGVLRDAAGLDEATATLDGVISAPPPGRILPTRSGVRGDEPGHRRPGRCSPRPRRAPRAVAATGAPTIPSRGRSGWPTFASRSPRRRTPDRSPSSAGRARLWWRVRGGRYAREGSGPHRQLGGLRRRNPDRTPPRLASGPQAAQFGPTAPNWSSRGGRVRSSPSVGGDSGAVDRRRPRPRRGRRARADGDHRGSDGRRRRHVRRHRAGGAAQRGDVRSPWRRCRRRARRRRRGDRRRVRRRGVRVRLPRRRRATRASPAPTSPG